jgi:tetratricopeptide (TPR) repeat protein
MRRYVLLLSLSLTGLPLFAAPTQAAEDTPSTPHTQAPPIEDLLSGLRKRLESDPNNADGWALLARSYFHLGQVEEAQAAAAKARSLGYTQEIIPSAKAPSGVNPHTSKSPHPAPAKGSLVDAFFSSSQSSSQ